MSVYEVVNGLADDSMVVDVVRRDGYAVCSVARTDVGTLRMDYGWCVVLWGRNVLETELRDGGHTIRLFIE